MEIQIDKNVATHLAVHVAKKKVEKKTFSFSKRPGDGNDDNAAVLNVILEKDFGEGFLVEFETVIGMGEDDLNRMTEYFGLFPDGLVVHRERLYSLALSETLCIEKKKNKFESIFLRKLQLRNFR